MVGNVCGLLAAGRSSTCSSRATSRASSPAIAADARGGRAPQDPPAGLRTYLCRGNLRSMVREGKVQTQFLRRGLGNAATVVAVTMLIVGGLVAPASAAENSYTVTNLVSDVPGLAAHVDPTLVNAWGLTSLPTSPWWVADNGTNVSTLYRADGTKVPLTVQVPNAPTGAVSNSGSHFVVANGTSSGPALFIFATEEGKILGWNPNVSLTQTQVAVDHSGIGAVYKALAIASTPTGDFLYATDFHNGRVDVFDGNFQQVNTPGAFVDPGIPAGYAPFGIQNVNGT